MRLVDGRRERCVSEFAWLLLRVSAWEFKKIVGTDRYFDDR